MKVNDLRKEIRKKVLSSITMLSEISNLPLGAEFDKRAPYNATEDVQIDNYKINYDDRFFEVSLSNGKVIDVDFIDFLGEYWKNTPGSYEELHGLFGYNEENSDAEMISYLRNKNYDFTTFLYSVIAKNPDNLENVDDESFF